MAPDTMRNAVNLAAADARRAIEALQEQSISLQRELAEARAEIDSLKSRPSLAPLTDESVRGVLVDDGPVRNVFDYGECYLDLKDGSINTCWENARDPWSHNMQPVKLRPASEFGVAADPEFVREYHRMRDGLQAAKNAQKLTRDLFAKTIAALADALGKKGPFDESRTATIALGLIQMVQELVAARGEPGLKPLPEGWKLLRPNNHGTITVGEHHFSIADSTLYGTADQAERIKELEEVRVSLIGDRAELYEEWRIASAELDRLRSAIEEHRHRNTGMACDHKKSDLDLWSALAQPGDGEGRTEAFTERLVGRLDKPFHRPECQCAECKAWIAANPQPAPAAAGDEAEPVREVFPGGSTSGPFKPSFVEVPTADYRALLKRAEDAEANVRKLAPRVESLEADMADLRELWRHLCNSNDTEERESCEKAIHEILENKPSGIRRLDDTTSASSG